MIAFEYLIKRFCKLNFYFVGGTFAESFYGLQRVPIKQANSQNILPRKHFILSLIFVAILPYLKMKFNKVAEKMYFDELPYTYKVFCLSF